MIQGAAESWPTEAQLAAARVFVNEFAEVNAYGGGCEARLLIEVGANREILRARDGWKGRDHALDDLARQVADRFA